jgi:hypothetical protein
MARDGQKDRICHWLPLTIFIGMGLDTLLNLIEGLQEERTDDGKKADLVPDRSKKADLVPDRSKIFLRMIGPEAQALMIKVRVWL